MNIPRQTATEQNHRIIDTSDRKSIFDQLRSIWVKQKACDNTDQVVRSKDFRRAFSKVLNLHPEYNKESILKTLLNIRDQTYINPEKQTELLTCISDPEFILNAKYTQNRLKWFAAREAAIFLELYPVSEILTQLKLYVSDEIKETFTASQDKSSTEELPDHETNLSTSEYSINIERKILWVDYILAKKEINGKTKWACKTKWSLLFNADFIYDNISWLSEFWNTRDKVFVSVSNNDKSAYISLEQIILDNEIYKEQRFDSVGSINSYWDKIIYDVTENGKTWFIVAGQEEETRWNILFDRIHFRPILDWPRFYLAQIWNKEAYFEQGSIISKSDLKRMNKEITAIEENNDWEFFYTYKVQGKFFIKKTIKHIFKDTQREEVKREEVSIEGRKTDWVHSEWTDSNWTAIDLESISENQKIEQTRIAKEKEQYRKERKERRAKRAQQKEITIQRKEWEDKKESHYGGEDFEQIVDEIMERITA